MLSEVCVGLRKVDGRHTVAGVVGFAEDAILQTTDLQLREGAQV